MYTSQEILAGMYFSIANALKLKSFAESERERESQFHCMTAKSQWHLVCETCLH